MDVQVRAMASYLEKRAAEALHVEYETGRVVRVEQAGTGDRYARQGVQWLAAAEPHSHQVFYQTSLQF